MIDLTPLPWELAVEGPPGSALQWRPIGAACPVAATLAGALDRDDDPRLDAQTWWYRVRFDAPPGSGTLVFEGLATLAEAWLNGTRVLESRNMFRRHAVAVRTLLREAGNELTIRFASLDDALGQRRPRPRWRVPMLRHQQLRWFRTTLLGRTPGWSPPLPVVGPWRPIRLLGDADRLPRLQRLHAGLDGADGVLELSLELDMAGGAARLQLLPPAGAGGIAGPALECPLVAAAGLHHATLRVPQVQRWWPHTHGDPALYAAGLVLDAPGAAGRRIELGSIGFRSVAVDTGGGGFGLRVNGEPVFCRGACWMPLDTLRLHASPADYDAAVAQARSAGVNMLRLSGTTVYEDGAFFEACDRAGILVWQDLMFASMDYPADDAAFAAEVNAEVDEQLGRLQRHPSLAVVCGNSEVDQLAAMGGAPRDTWTPPLFHDRLRRQVHDRLGAAQPYWPSSSHGGDFPFQPAAGTCSYYGVGAYLRAVDEASSAGPRFATECLAFANIPDDAGLRRLGGGAVPAVHAPRWKARSPRDLGAGWDFDDVREHYVERVFGLVPGAVRYGDPARHLRLGRAAMAEVMAEAFTRWRQPGSRCGGALVWSWRDLRSGAGWGVVDDAGFPKSTLHALRRVLQPRHLGWVDQGLDGLFVHVVNETPDPLHGELALSLYRHGETRVAHSVQALAIGPRGAWKASALAAMDGFADLNGSYRFGPPMADVAVATLRAGGLALEAVRFLDAAGVRHPVETGLAGHASPRPDGRMAVTLSTRAAARSVWFDADGWRPDDEYFDLPPHAQREIVFSPLPGPTRAWRTLAGALNQREPVLLPLRPATAIP